MQTPLAAVWLYHVQFGIFKRNSIHSNANSNTQMQFQSFERNFGKLKCSSNRSNPNANHLNANLRWLWWPRSTLRHRVWSATEPHLFRAMAALCLHYVCTMSALCPQSLCTVSAAFPQQSRSLSALIPQYCRCSALCPHCSRGLSAVFPHRFRSLGCIVPTVLGSFLLDSVT